MVALICCLAEPGDGLGLVLADTFPGLVHHAQVVLGLAQSVLGGPAVPRDGLGIALGHAPPVLVHHAEPILCPGVALLGRFPQPVHSLGIVPGHALPGLVHHAQVVLGLAQPVLGGPAVPRDGLGIVLGHAPSILVHHAEPILCLLAAALGGFAEPGERVGFALSDAFPVQVGMGHLHLRGRVALLRRFPVPRQGLHIGLGHAFPLLVHVAQPTLGPGVPLFCRPAEPGGGIPITLGHLAPGQAGHSQEELTEGPALLRRLPEPQDGFRFVFLGALARPVDPPQHCLGLGVTLLRQGPKGGQRLPVEDQGPSLVLGGPLPFFVGLAEIQLPPPEALCRRLVVAFEGLGLILLQAAARKVPRIGIPKAHEPPGIPLVGGLARVFQGLHGIGRRSHPVLVHPAQARLSFGMALVGSFDEVDQGFLVVLRNTLPEQARQAQPVGLFPRLSLRGRHRAGGCGYRTRSGPPRPEVELAREAGAVPGHLCIVAGLLDTYPHFLEDLLHLEARFFQGPQQLLGVETVPAITIRSRAAGGRGEGHEGSRGCLHLRQATAGAPEAAGEGVVAAGVQDDEVDPVLRRVHPGEHSAGIQGLGGHVLFGGDVRTHGDEEIHAPHLHAVTGVVEEAHASGREPLPEAPDRLEHPLPPAVQHQIHLKTQFLEGRRHGPGIVGRVLQRCILVGPVANDQRHPFFIRRRDL